LGHLTLKSEALTLQVNSRRRLEAGKELLTQQLGSSIQHQADDIKSIEDMLAQTSAQPEEESEEEELPEEIEAMQAEMEAQYHREWLDQKIPALGDRTPREAVRTFEGRVRVMRLLKEMEAVEGARVRDGKLAYDFAELTQELGITFVRAYERYGRSETWLIL
jgi:Antitoxin Xre/MbcA/ParS C-terminal toxin-binding domain